MTQFLAQGSVILGVSDGRKESSTGLPGLNLTALRDFLAMITRKVKVGWKKRG